MNASTSTDLLNRLLVIVTRSFPQYIRFAQPYILPGRRAVGEAIEAIVDDQEGLSDRICQMIVDAGQIPHRGNFPMQFTDKHDLSVDYLVDISRDYMRQDIALLDRLIDQMQQAPAAKALAEEARGMAKGHLETLQELVEER